MTQSELIDDLVAANRILADRGIFDAYGHISARDPKNKDRYWLTRSMAPAQVAADDIIEFDLDNTPLRPMVGSAAFLGEGAPVFDIRTVDDDGDLNVCTVPQASALAKALAAHWLVLLRRHGAVMVGNSVRQCVRHAIIAETNARAQIEATILGPVHFLTASEIAYAKRMQPKDVDRAWQHWKRKAMGSAS